MSIVPHDTVVVDLTVEQQMLPERDRTAFSFEGYEGLAIGADASLS